MGDPEQMFSLREFELSPILPTSVNTNAPSSTIAGCLWLYVFLILCCYLPVLKPNLIYGPSSSGCDFCHRIALFFVVVVVVVPHLTHCGHILLRDCNITQVSVPTACSANMSLVSAAGIKRDKSNVWTVHLGAITHLHRDKDTQQQPAESSLLFWNIKY